MWTDEDRLLVLGLLHVEEETCEICGHPKSECRDQKTAGTWQVLTEICQPGRVAQAVAEDNKGSRGVVYMTKRTEGHG